MIKDLLDGFKKDWRRKLFRAFVGIDAGQPPGPKGAHSTGCFHVARPRSIGSVDTLLHFALLHWHADRNTVAKLFSAGKHLPPATMFSVVLFMTARLFTILCIPAMILEEIGKAVVDRYLGTPPS